MQSLIALSFLAFAQGIDGYGPASDVDVVDKLTEAPKVQSKDLCVCPATAERPDVTIRGAVIDAQVILGADQRSVEDRMATIFDVEKSSNGDYSGRTKIWHDVSEKSCGVTFDYGRKYSVPARINDDGELETDRCLMGE